MIADVPGIVTALIVSGTVSVGASLMNQNTQSRLLEDNIVATRDLSKNVNILTTQLAVFEEKYVTKGELDLKLKEVR